MTDSASEDSVTKLNTQLNKSMVLMENVVDAPSPNYKRKSITINTEVESSKAINSPVVKSRRSILKKSDKHSENVASDETAQTNGIVDRLSEATSKGLSLPASVLSRPHTLEEIAQKETLYEENMSSTFNLEDVSDSEEMWIMDVPRLIDPQEFHGQTIVFEDKSKFRIKDERYCIIAHKMRHNVTCVFNTQKNIPQYKTVNVKPTGFLTVRRKLSGPPEVKPVSTENSDVQFPDHLKARHPLFGVIRERKKRSKKRNSLKEI
ncbi:uncharacterized protein LOC105835533 [Monomorium pharaonis]|uniref:uncharacterized protein LOC105835533 n=1 Tax=Monomorium pharaonis TaxID=307658 RepID=UPI00063EFAC3|nr:uncharacterized protein LOC105835533 [Monomorium pharaonis]